VRSVRVVTLNLWNLQKDVAARMRVAAAGLAALQPDVVALQEVAEPRGGANQAEILARALEGQLVFDVVAESGDVRVGNAVITRLPVRRRDSTALPSAADDPRRAMYVELDTPLGALPFVNCHLSWEMWHAPRREAQVVALDEFVRAKASAGQLPSIVCGDFNTPPDSAVIYFMTGHMGLAGRGTYYRDAWARRHPHEDGHTWSDRNPHAVRRIERNRRLDYIFVGQIREDGWGAILDARVVLDIPGPDQTYASDHFGAYAEVGVARAEEAV
jgi:endonuclease/exonuclease/phosphatase family metal-dependent hydrolase